MAIEMGSDLDLNVFKDEFMASSDTDEEAEDSNSLETVRDYSRRKRSTLPLC